MANLDSLEEEAELGPGRGLDASGASPRQRERAAILTRELLAILGRPARPLQPVVHGRQRASLVALPFACSGPWEKWWRSRRRWLVACWSRGLLRAPTSIGAGELGHQCPRRMPAVAD